MIISKSHLTTNKSISCPLSKLYWVLKVIYLELMTDFFICLTLNPAAASTDALLWIQRQHPRRISWIDQSSPSTLHCSSLSFSIFMMLLPTDYRLHKVRIQLNLKIPDDCSLSASQCLHSSLRQKFNTNFKGVPLAPPRTRCSFAHKSLYLKPSSNFFTT